MDAAVAICKNLTRADVSIVDGAITLGLDPGRAAELNRRLVSNDVDVYEIRPLERSLEEVFFEMTEEK